MKGIHTNTYSIPHSNSNQYSPSLIDDPRMWEALAYHTYCWSCIVCDEVRELQPARQGSATSGNQECREDTSRKHEQGKYFNVLRSPLAKQATRAVQYIGSWETPLHGYI